jgi:aldehyde:ferredoxin oxidoreductase
MDKILRINMSNLSVSSEEVPASWAQLGGRALTSTIVSAEVPPSCHPLGPNNKLVFAHGMLSGTTAVNTNRLSAGAKSPLTGGIKESSAGGTTAQMLAKLGIKALIIEGAPAQDAWYRIHIDKSGARIQEEKELVGKGNFAVFDAMGEQVGKKCGCLSIGHAGEFKMTGANISVRDKDGKIRSHGRGGLGAVMGSKKVKLISIDDTGCKGITLADPEKFRTAAKIFSTSIVNQPGIAHGMKPFGTAMLINAINEAGALPAYNFRNGQYPNHEKVSGETMRETILARGGEPSHGCAPGCAIQCSQVYVDEDKQFVTSGLEYETISLLGPGCDIDNLDQIAAADRLMDDIGVDSIEMSGAIAVAMEAGILKFGDAAGVLRLLKEEVALGTPLGRVIGCGAGTTGTVYGVTRVATVKNQAIPAYDPRPIKGIGITYATSPMGADHTAGYAIGPTLAGAIDGHKKDGQVELSRHLQFAAAAVDSFGICLFADMAISGDPQCVPALVDMLNARSGENKTAEDYIPKLGSYVLKIEHEFNCAAGLTSQQDRLPDFFSAEELPPHNLAWDFTGQEIDAFWNF